MPGRLELSICKPERQQVSHSHVYMARYDRTAILTAIRAREAIALQDRSKIRPGLYLGVICLSPA